MPLVFKIIHPLYTIMTVHIACRALALTYIEGGSDPAERLGADEVDEEEDGGGEERGRGGRHEGREGEPQVGGVLGPVPQQQELRDQAQNLDQEEKQTMSKKSTAI